MSEAPFRDTCAQLGLSITTTQIDNLLKLKDFFVFYGRSMNITSSVDALDGHFTEALGVVALARKLDIAGRWLDVGSGGGFPGLILATMLDLPIVLVEPRAKRASALELALAQIGRPDVRVLRGRLERGKWVPIDAGWLEPGFAAASARAVFAPDRWIDEVRKWVAPGGTVVLHLRAGELPPTGCVELGRVEIGGWAAIGVQNLPATA